MGKQSRCWWGYEDLVRRREVATLPTVLWCQHYCVPCLIGWFLVFEIVGSLLWNVETGLGVSPTRAEGVGTIVPSFFQPERLVIGWHSWYVGSDLNLRCPESRSTFIIKCNWAFADDAQSSTSGLTMSNALDVLWATIIVRACRVDVQH